PFYVEMLAREADDLGLVLDPDPVARLRRLGPAPVARSVLVRGGSTSPEAVALAPAAAGLGEGAGLAELAAPAGAPGREAVETVDQLVALDVLRWDGRVEFVHPIVREAVYADMRPTERALAHGAAADLLAAGGAADERVAAQVVRAPPCGSVARVELLLR